MAVNKNFVVKNGLEVNTDLLFADSSTRSVGVGSTSPNFDLDVRGGIGATDLRVTGFTTLTKDFQVGASGSAFYVSNTNNLVGVGTSVPAFLMDIRSSVSTGQTALYVKGDMRVTGDINLDDLTIDDLTVTGIATYKPDGSGGSPDSWIDIDYTGKTEVGGGTTIGIGSTAYFVDQARAVFGAGEDLSIYHNDNAATDTNVIASASGQILELRADKLRVVNSGVSEDIIAGDADGKVTLFHNGIAKFATTPGGVVVAGGSSITGISTVQDTTQSSSTTTGALQVSGGAGIAKNLYVGGGAEVTGVATVTGVLDANDTTQSSSSTTGAAKFAGGVGVAKNLFVGGGAQVTGVTTITGTLDANGALDVDGHTELDDVNVAGAATFAGAIDANSTSDFNGVVTVSNTTQSSSKDTGAIIVEGGVGIEKNLFVGGGAQVTGVSTFSDNVNLANTKTIKFPGASSDPGATLKHQSGHFEINNDTGNVYFDTAGNHFLRTGGSTLALTLDSSQNATFAGSVTVGSGIGVTTILDQDDMAANSATALASQQSIKAYVDTTVTAQDLDFQGDSGGAQNVDLDSQTFTISGTSNEIETTGSSQTLTIGLPDDVTITDVLTVSGTTQSSSKDTGTLILQGGAGIEKNLFVGGGAEITGITTVTGVLDANSNVDIAGDVDIDNTSQNQFNALTGALVVDGGTGIAKNLYVGGGAKVAGIATFSSNVYLQKADAANLYVGSTNAGGAALFLDGDSNGDWSGSDYSIIRHDTDGNLVLTANSPGAANCYIKLGASGHYGAMFKEGAESLLRYNNTTRIQTGPAGVIVTGIATADGFALGDNEKITFGASEDLKIEHNSNENYIDSNSGHIYIRANVNDDEGDNIYLQPKSGEDGITVTHDGAVILYQDGSERFTTTADGADISGTGSLKIPVGTTGQRSASPTDGDFRFNSSLNTFEGYSNSNWGEIGGGGGISTSYQNISSTSATGIATFSATAFRSASIILSVTQGTSYQAGRYMVIHDGTTPTVVEESAVATGSMIASFDATIGSGNLTFRATMGSSGIATVGIKVDTLRSDSIP
jgi:enhancing lycopene biosynthesis protein 2